MSENVVLMTDYLIAHINADTMLPSDENIPVYIFHVSAFQITTIASNFKLLAIVVIWNADFHVIPI